MYFFCTPCTFGRNFYVTDVRVKKKHMTFRKWVYLFKLWLFLIIIFDYNFAMRILSPLSPSQKYAISCILSWTIAFHINDKIQFCQQLIKIYWMFHSRLNIFDRATLDTSITWLISIVIGVDRTCQEWSCNSSSSIRVFIFCLVLGKESRVIKIGYYRK